MFEKPIFYFYNESSKINLKNHIENLKSKNKKIVFTNGCFDILHVGHLRYLKKARQNGDYLIIGLNTDYSIKQIKGSNRPIIPENERAELLLGLECVDCVVLFNETTPFEIITFIKPDVLVKGAQYLESNIVGADFVKSYGGTVIRAEMVENISTTSIIEKIIKLNNK